MIGGMDERPASTTKLYNKLLQLEATHDALNFSLSTPITSTDDKERIKWTECRYSIRNVMEELLKDNPSFVWEGSILSNQWKRLYYGIVEGSREFIVKVMSRLKGASNNSIDEVVVLCNDVISILEEGKGYFSILKCRLNENESFSIKEVNYLSPYNNTTHLQSSSELIKKLTHEMDIYCGDLARYQNWFRSHINSGSPYSQVDLFIAKRFYEKAIFNYPQKSIAYNQLAVVECKEDALLPAVLHYLIALTLPTPYLAANNNILTIARKIVTLSEEQLSLDSDPRAAVITGLLFRLMAAIIVDSLAPRKSQAIHISSISASLHRNYRMPSFRFIFDTPNPKPENILHVITLIMICLMEAISRGHGSAKSSQDIQYLSKNQLIIMEWILIIFLQFMERNVKIVDSSFQSIAFWLLHSDILSLIMATKRDSNEAYSFNQVWNKFLDIICDFANNGIKINRSLPVSNINNGPLPLIFNVKDATDYSSSMHLVKAIIEKLLSKKIILKDSSNALVPADLHETRQRRMLVGTKLAKLKLTNEIAQLTTATATDLRGEDENSLTLSNWHIIDGDTLMEHWNVIEQLLSIPPSTSSKRPTFRLIILLSTLHYLDYLKNDSEKMATCRKIMRFIASKTKVSSPQIHLQHPNEFDKQDLSKQPTEQDTLPKHYKGLLSAIKYFITQREMFRSLTVLSDDALLYKFLERVNVDQIIIGNESVSLYLNNYKKEIL